MEKRKEVGNKRVRKNKNNFSPRLLSSISLFFIPQLSASQHFLSRMDKSEMKFHLFRREITRYRWSLNKNLQSIAPMVSVSTYHETSITRV